jgi:hypothetical protein
MFSVVTVRDVQPEIRREVTRKVWKSFENPPSLRLPAWQAADYPPRRAGSGCHGFGAVAAATSGQAGEAPVLRLPAVERRITHPYPPAEFLYGNSSLRFFQRADNLFFN